MLRPRIPVNATGTIASPALRTAEINSTRTMIERAEERFDLKPARLIGDMAYGAAPMLGWLVEEKQIAPHIPVWDRTQRDDETLSSSDFQWDEQADEYRCPQGKLLRKQRRTFKNLRTHVTKAGTIIYRASQSDCASCVLKTRCCPNTPMRKIARSVHDVTVPAGTFKAYKVKGFGVSIPTTGRGRGSYLLPVRWIDPTTMIGVRVDLEFEAIGAVAKYEYTSTQLVSFTHAPR
jgi:hypothetical protein